MFRIYYLIFWWKEHKVHEGHHKPSDQPWTMTLPLVILAVVSCLARFRSDGQSCDLERCADV